MMLVEICKVCGAPYDKDELEDGICWECADEDVTIEVISEPRQNNTGQ
jgi:predicted amidophosphoribosyltransferase